jgi:alkylhydroperoxidase/carboxymuconolactone decarboxylase family protein YurZ
MMNENKVAYVMNIFRSKMPQMQKKFAETAETIAQTSTYDEKTRELINFAILIPQNSALGAKTHAMKFLSAGGKQEDLYSVLVQAIPITGIGPVFNILPEIADLEEK